MGNAVIKSSGMKEVENEIQKCEEKNKKLIGEVNSLKRKISDLKENEAVISDGITRIKQLIPRRFNYKSEPEITQDGFFAHEVQAIIPEAVDGEKDAVDVDGNIDPQGIDQSKLVPLLVKTIQELEARITALENAE